MSKIYSTIFMLYLLCSFNFVLTSRLTGLKDRNSMLHSNGLSNEEKDLHQHHLEYQKNLSLAQMSLEDQLNSTLDFHNKLKDKIQGLKTSSKDTYLLSIQSKENMETYLKNHESITNSLKANFENFHVKSDQPTNNNLTPSQEAIDSFAALKTTIEAELEENNKKTKQVKFGETVKNLAGLVSQSISKAIPLMFCWKEGGDFGRIPTDCPTGMFRSLALCYDNCNSGYYHWGGVCWQTCPAGTTDIGAICTGYGFKKSYIPRSLTNFDASIPCPGDLYKAGALCYRNCKTIGMENCGIGACSRSALDCAASIITMIIDTILGLVDLALFALSFGSSTALTGLKTKLKDMAKGGISAAIKTMKSYVKQIGTAAFREKVIKMAKEKAMTVIKDATSVAISDATITKLVDLSLEKEEQRNLAIFNQDWFISNLDPLAISGVVNNCKAAGSTVNDGITCASAVFGTLSKIDPTGIASIAAAFAKPVCAVPDSLSAEQKKKNEEIANLIKQHEETEKLKEKDHYVKIFTGDNYTGEWKEYSELVSNDNLITLPTNFVNKIKSMMVGKYCDIALCGTKDGSDTCVPIPVGNYPTLDKLLATSTQRLLHNKISLSFSQGAYVYWQTDYKGKKQYISNDTEFLSNPIQSIEMASRNSILVYTKKVNRLFGGSYADGSYNLKDKYNLANPSLLAATAIYKVGFQYHAKPGCVMIAKDVLYQGSKTQFCRNMRTDATWYTNNVYSFKVSSNLKVALIADEAKPRYFFELHKGGAEVMKVNRAFSNNLAYIAPHGEKCIILWRDANYKGEKYWTCRSRTLQDLTYFNNNKIGSIQLAYEGADGGFDFFLDTLPDGNGISYSITKSMPTFDLPLDKLTNAVIRIINRKTKEMVSTEEDGEIY